MVEKSKEQAQQRADQVAHFNAELKSLADDNVLRLSDEQQAAIHAYHAQLLTRYSETFDIDTSSKEKQLSMGMRIASFLGALALAASVFFLFYQFWGRFPTSLQIAISIVSPVAALAATLHVAQREKTGYFSKLLALITIACFVLNLVVLGQIYNIMPSDRAFIIWGALAFLLAYACDVRLLLVAAIICLDGVLSARVGVWSGCYWVDFGERPENFLPAAVIIFALPFVIRHRRYTAFEPIYRVYGLLVFFLPVLILAYWGNVSYFNLDNNTIEVIYQIVGFVSCAAMIAFGIRRGLSDVVNTANTFFVIFLYTKIYEWCWEWMPKYVFFLLVGLIAVLMLFIFKRIRDLMKAQVREIAA